jgi:hypothetical protein
VQAHSTLVVERRKRRKAGNFANPLRAEKPFQTLQRLQDAAKIGTCRALASQALGGTHA